MIDFDLNESMRAVQKEVEAWPDWMKHIHGITIKKKTKKQKQSEAALQSFLDAWARHMDGYYVGKYSEEIDSILEKSKKAKKK